MFRKADDRLELLECKGKVTLYLPWQDKWVETKIDDGVLQLPEFKRSIIIKIKK